MPETLVKAAEHFHNLAHPFDPREADAWVERANDAAYAYTKRFMQTTTAAMRAREGGYEVELKGYVREAAWVQAQLIEGGKVSGIRRMCCSAASRTARRLLNSLRRRGRRGKQGISGCMSRRRKSRFGGKRFRRRGGGGS